MKTLLITLGLAAPMMAVKFAPCLWTETACATPRVQDGGDEHADHHDALEEDMETIEQSLGALRRAIRDEATFPAGLEALSKMEAATVRAKDQIPPMVADLPEAERAAFVRDYRKMMVEMLSAQLTCELALLDGDGESATEAFKALRAFEDDGHERFTRSE